MAAELTSVALVKAYLGITATTADTQLGLYTLVADARIRAICNRPDGWLNSSAHTQKFPGSGFEFLSLRDTPVTAITSIKVYTTSTSSVTMDSTWYRINDEANAVLMSGGWRVAWDAGWDVGSGMVVGYGDAVERRRFSGVPNHLNAYPYTEVIYTGGYANQAAIPDDLENAANELTAWIFRKSKVDATNTTEKPGSTAMVVNWEDFDAYARILLRGHVREIGI